MSTYRFELRLPSEGGSLESGAELTVSGGGRSQDTTAVKSVDTPAQDVSLPFEDTRFEVDGECTDARISLDGPPPKPMSAFKAVMAGVVIGLALPMGVLGMAIFFCFAGPSLEKAGLVNPFGCAASVSSAIGQTSAEKAEPMWAAWICKRVSIPFSATQHQNIQLPNFGAMKFSQPQNLP